MLRLFFLIVAFLGILSDGSTSCVAAGYDPMTIPDSFESQTLDVEVTDSKRDRVIPVRVYLPESPSPQPVILFSHGMGGDREASPYLGNHWSARGYVVVFLQHAGSDSAIWRNVPLGERMPAMRRAASGQNFLERNSDVAAVLDQLTQWNQADDHILKGRLDLDHVGMSGHSFGAKTTQAVSGQSAIGGIGNATEKRIDAAIAMSPSPPRRGDPATAFGEVAIPWMLMTGTKDTGNFSDQTVESRRSVYPALPPGDKYELLLDGAEHAAFGERPERRLRSGPTQRGKRNHHRAIQALSTAFWDSYLRNDKTAKDWLTGHGPRSVLEADDRFQSK